MPTRTIVGKIWLPFGSVGYSGQTRIDRNLTEDGEVKEMIIGVGNEQTTYLGSRRIGSELSEPSDPSFPVPMGVMTYFFLTG